MGKVAIVTGADGGMGRHLSKALASHGYEVIMASENTDRALPVYDEIRKLYPNTKLLPLNLASFNSIEQFCQTIKESYTHIDILLNNAGILPSSLLLTENNFECTVGINYLGHYILTRNLLPLFQRGSRIVNTISLSYKYGKITPAFFSIPPKDKFNRFAAYSNSKLALFYFTMDLAEELSDRGIMVNCADPGIVSTNIIRLNNRIIDAACDLLFRPFIKTPERGAAAIAYPALAPEAKDVTGALFVNKKRRILSAKKISNPQRTLLKKMTEEILLQTSQDKEQNR